MAHTIVCGKNASWTENRMLCTYNCHSTTCSFTEFESEGKNKKSPWQFHLSRHCLLLLATSQPHIHHQLSEKFSALGRECSWERCIPVLQKWHLQKSSCDNRVKIEIRAVLAKSRTNHSIPVVGVAKWRLSTLKPGSKPYNFMSPHDGPQSR